MFHGLCHLIDSEGCAKNKICPECDTPFKVKRYKLLGFDILCFLILNFDIIGSDWVETSPDNSHGRDSVPLSPLLEELQFPHRSQGAHQEGAPDAPQHRHRRQGGDPGGQILSDQE